MKKFNIWLEEKNDIGGKIDHLISVTSALPDTDVLSDLFQDKNKKQVCLGFFRDIKNVLPDQELESRLGKFNLDGNYLNVYHDLNSPKSPVRNYLITRSIK